MYCVYCGNRERCLDRIEQPLLLGCKSGFPNNIVHTNADRIRAMSIEELAEFLCCVFDEGSMKFICGITIPHYDEEKIAEWLKSPVEQKGAQA